MSFETADYPLVFRLDVCSEIWLEILNLDVLKVVGRNMSRKVVLKQENSASFRLKVTIPSLDPVLIKVSRHPGLCVVPVIKPELFTRLLFESSWACCFSDNKGRAAHRTVTVVGRMSTAVFVGLSTLHGTARV